MGREGPAEERLEMARKMLQSGMDVITIVKITDLDRAKTEEIKKQLDCISYCLYNLAEVENK